MKTSVQWALRPYTAPSCKDVVVLFDGNFLATDSFGGEGHPGADLEPGEEYEF